MRLLYLIQKWILPTVYEFWIILIASLTSTATLIFTDLIISRYLRHTILYPLFETHIYGFLFFGIVTLFVWLNVATVIVNAIYNKNRWLKIDSNSYL